MKITFFGTSHGKPEPHRRCSCTMITLENGNRYFVDMGSSPIDDMVSRGIPLNSVKAVWITHMHGDHTNGLLQLIELSEWAFPDTVSTVLLPEQSGIDALLAWNAATREDGGSPDRIVFGTIHEGVTYEDDSLRVTAFVTHHCLPLASYAFLVEGDGKRVLFTGDLNGANPEKDFPVQCAQEQPLDLAICEAVHFDPMRYIPIFRACQLRRVILNHYASYRLSSICELIKAAAPLRVSLATDDLEVTV